MDISINVYNENKILFHDIIIHLQYEYLIYSLEYF